MKKYSAFIIAFIILVFAGYLNAQFIQQGDKLVGNDAAAGSVSGSSVAISADGNTAIAGGYADNNTGAAWIFVRQNGVWTQQGSKLVGTGAAGSAYQGNSVGISADGNTVIIGGYCDNSNIGAAWIFTRAGGVWTQQGSKLVGTGAAGMSLQGSSVALSSDGNTAIVGGSNDNNRNGAVWIFTRQNGTWTQQGGKLISTDASGTVGLGAAVSISGDGNTAIAGGAYYSNNTGGAWIFTRQNGTWTQQGSRLIGTGSAANDLQGISVDISSDGNTAVFGGQGHNSRIGAAWIFTRQGGLWTQQGKLVGTGNIGPSYQGYSASISSDGNTAVVGGSNDDAGKGAVWVFSRQGGVWTQLGNKLVGTGASGSAFMGWSAAISSDGNTIISGGIYDNSRKGAAWIFFRELDPGAPVPIISYPAGGITVYITNPVVTWYITSYYPGAKYHLQVSEQADFSTIAFAKDNISATQQEITGLSGGKTYYLRVRLKTPQGQYGYYSPVQSFKVQAQSGTEPAVPVISYPLNGTVVYTSSPVVSWYITQLAPPLKYQLQLSMTNDFSNPVLDVQGIDGLTYQLTNLTGGGAYYLRVRSYTSTGSYSAYSQPVSFTVNSTSGTMAVTPVISYPTGGVTIYTTSTYINWYINSYQPAQKYNLQLSTMPDFGALILDQDNIAALQYQVTGLTPGIVYYARVRGKAEDGSYSLFSSIAQFTVAPGSYFAGELNNDISGTEKENFIPENYSLSQNYPNPFNPVTIIEYGLPEDGKVTLEVFNLLGEKLAALVNELKKAGSYKAEWNAVDRKSGIYFYRLQVSGLRTQYTEVRKMVQIK
ncbi:MAG: T9SS type A sorting domain-containing protein [archaeon]